MIRRFVLLLSLIIVAFIGLTIALQTLSKGALKSIQSNRQETAQINAQMAASLTKEQTLKQVEAGNTKLRELLTSQSRLPGQLTAIAQTHAVQITNVVFPSESEPTVAGSGLAQASLVAPTQASLISFLTQIESSTPFLSIHEASVTPQIDGRYQARITLRFFTP